MSGAAMRLPAQPLIDHAQTRQALRALIARIEGGRYASAGARCTRPQERNLSVGALVWTETEHGVIGARALRYGMQEVVGTQPLAPLFALDARTVRFLSRGDRELAQSDVSVRDLLFFDIETTGLGGAGVTIFMVALARVEGDELVLQQYVSPSPADEFALLDAVLRECRLADDPILVTYNGITFDAPFMDERATLHRRRAGLRSARHLDLLHAVRRGYRGLLPSHRLGVVEAALLGVTRPAFEVSGAAVPAWYFRFVRSGSARFLDPLLDHNASDVLSLAALVAHLHEGAAAESGSGGGDPRRAYALGRLALAAGMHDDAACYLERAADGLPVSSAREDAVRELSMICRARGEWASAVQHWHWLAAHAPSHAPWARRQLAIYYEHRAPDPVRALEVLGEAPSGGPREHADWTSRRARLLRKLAKRRSA